MSNIFFTSDTHFSHSNIIKYCNRPYKDILEMNEALISNWNNLVKKGDLVYHLGDFGFGSFEDLKKIRERLNGEICFIRGNHDKTIKNQASLFTWVKEYYEMKLDKIDIILCHYPFLTWNKEYHGSIALSGHTHSDKRVVTQSKKGIHVGVDAWNYTPVSWDQIKNLAERIEVKEV
jgi:calcineurin-like phosphoesterase family protein